MIETDTKYDALRRVNAVSNPYRPGETIYWTTTLYDALGRATEVKTSGDEARVITSYSGNQSTVTDEAEKKKRTNTNVRALKLPGKDLVHSHRIQFTTETLTT